MPALIKFNLFILKFTVYTGDFSLYIINLNFGILTAFADNEALTLYVAKMAEHCAMQLLSCRNGDENLEGEGLGGGGNYFVFEKQRSYR